MSAAPVLDVVCLCAAWCGTCREYEALFAALQQGAPSHRYRWIDIEDEADLVGDIDVETFPTLMVAWQGRVLFAGPVLPRLGDAQRLLAVQAERVSAWVAAGQTPAQPVLGLPADQTEAYVALAAALR
ncbi:thiol reductase thioredoxin [Aquabacterium olei]|uniref:Thiol reductase thioredoxin n=1 Tax=Aquabacterium olei TaxID=1296669 RepID=A0A2U8FUZ9_9BURK|nr:thioredoxin family protein [Aquabacterium olei]AWI54899.1 thiol reductase thioredoxin [Aquabacterium olei]